MMNKPFKVNYHSHTKRCGHAIGEDEEYVLAAIAAGYKIYGFSDHVMLPNRTQKGMRGDYPSDALDYFSSVRALAENYKDKIEIHLAFEAEWYYELYASYYDELLKKGIVDYMILGQHCFFYPPMNRFVFYGDLVDEKEATKRYARDLIAGMKSHDFIYVAHPDLFMSWYPKWDDFSRAVAIDIIKAAKEEHMILEVNMGPSRWGIKTGNSLDFQVIYPNEQFWHLVKEEGVPCIVGVDNHRPYELKDSPYDWVRRFLKRHELTPLEKLELPFAKN